jgi:hypothetical protein
MTILRVTVLRFNLPLITALLIAPHLQGAAAEKKDSPATSALLARRLSQNAGKPPSPQGSPRFVAALHISSARPAKDTQKNDEKTPPPPLTLPEAEAKNPLSPESAITANWFKHILEGTKNNS